MLLEIDATKLYGFNPLHDCVVKSMSVENNVLTMVVDGTHDSVKHYNKEEIIAEFYLSAQFSDVYTPVTMMSTGLWRSNNTPTLHEFCCLCNNKRYCFEVCDIYYNANNFCIVGFLSNRNHLERTRKVTIELPVDKVVYR